MTKTIFKVIYAALIFVFALFVIDQVMNKGNTDITIEMADATFPLVHVERDGTRINTLHGYNEQLSPAFACDTISPVDKEDRKLELSVDTFGGTLLGVSYEVRSTDGSRLVESSSVDNYLQEGNNARIHLTLKDLLEENTEYAFTLCLKIANSNVYYHTRIFLADQASHVDDEVAFALDFSSRTFDKERAKEITKYLESNADGDNTTFSKVGIHSSFSQITWGSLEVKKETEPEVYVRRINPYVANVELRYMLSMKEGTNDTLYQVKEYYYLRFGIERIYLLDFERTMNSIFLPEAPVYTNNKISLGITDPDIEMKESDDGNVFAFVKEGRLFSCNMTGNKIALLFGFYDEAHQDARDYYDNHHIKILSVDETGNVRFLVYGYMNRGNHEGGVGVTCYYYNSMLNTIEEEIYIPYTTSADLLSKDVSQLAYVNSNNYLFLILQGSIYKINLDEKSYETLQENLSYGSYKVSSDNRMIVWQEGSSTNAGEKLMLLNLNSERETEIEAGANHYIKPLGFMNEDLIYGIAQNSHLMKDAYGNLITPMYMLQIQNENGQVLKKYNKSGVFVTGTEIVDNQIILHRIEMGNEAGKFTEIADDQIMNDVVESSAKNYVEVVPTQEFEKIVQLAIKSSIKTDKLKYLTPKQVMYEGERLINLEDDMTSHNFYYVYDKYGIQDIFENVSAAIRLAEERNGRVMDSKGRYVWDKSHRNQVNQIMKIKEEQVTEEKSSMCVCLETILKSEGINLDCSRPLASGKSFYTILSENLTDCEVYDLSGCSLESILYYVGMDIPVMAVLNSGEAVLIVGYNELNTVILNPNTGIISKMGMNDSVAFFEANGNNFISYYKDNL